MAVILANRLPAHLPAALPWKTATAAATGALRRSIAGNLIRGLWCGWHAKQLLQGRAAARLALRRIFSTDEQFLLVAAILADEFVEGHDALVSGVFFSGVSLRSSPLGATENLVRNDQLPHSCWIGQHGCNLRGEVTLLRLGIWWGVTVLQAAQRVVEFLLKV